MQFKVGNYRDGDWVSNIRMLTGTIKADWIQLPVERYLAALPTLRHGWYCWWHLDLCLTFSLLRGNRQSKQDVLMTVWASSAHGTGKKKNLHWGMGSLLECSGTKVLLPGALLGLRSCSFPSFSLMICHWMIGMRRSTPCQRCGLRLPCWEMTTCAKLLAMTFISWGRSMMSRACGATLLHNSDSWRASLRPKGLAGIHLLSVKSGGCLQTSRIGQRSANLSRIASSNVSGS